MSDTPRIYRACLACYNDGNLVGNWFDATDIASLEAWEVEHQDATGHEEYAVHDYDSMIDLGEYPDLGRIEAFAELIEEYSFDAVDAYVSMVGDQYATPAGFQDDYRGEWDDEEDYARSIIDDCGDLRDIPEHIARYFDYAAYARDLFIDDVYASDRKNGKIHVFSRS